MTPRQPPAVEGAPAPVFWLTPADGREVLCGLHEGCGPDLHQELKTQGELIGRVIWNYTRFDAKHWERSPGGWIAAL